jgi:hypothetical protein
MLKRRVFPENGPISRKFIKINLEAWHAPCFPKTAYLATDAGDLPLLPFLA